jgi:hypothetical protein
VARFASGKCRVEYPIGKVLYENVGYVTNLRFSPQGDAIAFMDLCGQSLMDNSGSVGTSNESRSALPAQFRGFAHGHEFVYGPLRGP